MVKEPWRVLHGFGIGGYRSFGPTPQLFTKLEKVNFVAGQNNAGKTNVLQFLRDVPLVTNQGFTLEDLDRSQIAGADDLRAWRAVVPRPSGSWFPADVFRQTREAGSTMLDAFYFEEASPLVRDGLAWLPMSATFPGAGVNLALQLDVVRLEELIQYASARFAERAISDLCLDLTGSASDAVSNIRSITSKVFDPQTDLPRLYVPEQRELTASEQYEEATGRGLISRLRDMQHPDLGFEADRRSFEALEELVKVVLDDPRATFEIPGTADKIIIESRGRRLPVSSLGAGVSQTIVLAALAATRSATLLLVEEPEANLHPRLQRHLLRFLVDSTENQYLIATHSAQMLDAEVGQIFHIQLDAEGVSSVAACPAPQTISDLCHDLGYRPSDLLQSNCVIWVEGPSDRVYLLHWLGQVRPDLREDFDFSVMFYGGSLLTHLSGTDAALDDFVSLRRLNRHHAILIDSDRVAEDDVPNSTKLRVVEEFKTAAPGCFAWLTPCRTIENLVPTDLLARAVKLAHPVVGENFEPPASMFDAPTNLGQSSPNKLAIAHHVCDLWTPEVPLPMKVAELIDQVVELVRVSAGGPAAQVDGITAGCV